MCKKFTQVFFKETKTQRGWKVKTRLDDCPYPMAIRWISSHDSNVTKCCLSDTQFFFFFFHFLSRFISLSQSVCPYPPILVFSFLYKDYLFLFNWDRVSHAAQHLKTRSSRTFRPALSIVRLRSFILFFHVSQTSRLLNVSLLETAQPLVNVTFRPNNSRDSRLGYTKKKKNASSLSSSKLPCTEEPLMDAGNPHPKLREKKTLTLAVFFSFVVCLFFNDISSGSSGHKLRPKNTFMSQLIFNGCLKSFDIIDAWFMIGRQIWLIPLFVGTISWMIMRLRSVCWCSFTLPTI